ncbi:hypothetical protein SOVF_105550 [Spinacia oleracea]|uniref:PNO1 second type I KH domain-containing protein n=1 Tax=Spinacia oleracea TaxID=3562 RepID=A0ABM3RCS7_SPIOL|nr:uncharacterized protein LOC110787904 [Spinacia oleracea]KNA14627.1 hypothetical protein SOVF_105550 [Spinacia oleracea]
MELPRKPTFQPIQPNDVSDGAELQFCFVPVPPNRRTPLEKAWKTQIYEPIRNEMKIDIRMNLVAKRVELKTMSDTPDISNLYKCSSYVQAFMLCFEPEQVREAFFKYDNLDMSSLDMQDVKRTLKGDHLTRAIGRICGKGGKIKFMIENATKTRIVVAGNKIHFVGTHDAIKIAKDCVCRLIMGSPAAKIASRLRTITARASERF